MDLLLAVLVWAVGAWLAYRCLRPERRHPPVPHAPGRGTRGPTEQSKT